MLEVLDHALSARLVVTARTNGANIKGLGLQGLEQGQVIELGVVCQSHHTGPPVWRKALHHVVWHVFEQCHTGHRPGARVFFPRVTNRHRKAAEQRHGGQVLGELPGADQQHAKFRAEGVDQGLCIQGQVGRGVADCQADRTTLQLHRAAHQLPAGERLHQRGQAGGIGVKFQQQLQGAATGQAKAVGLVGADAVLDQARRPARDVLFASRGGSVGWGGGWGIGPGEAVDQVVFNAAARDRTDHRAVLAQGHDGADRSG